MCPIAIGVLCELMLAGLGTTTQPDGPSLRIRLYSETMTEGEPAIVTLLFATEKSIDTPNYFSTNASLDVADLRYVVMKEDQSRVFELQPPVPNVMHLGAAIGPPMPPGTERQCDKLLPLLEPGTGEGKMRSLPPGNYLFQAFLQLPMGGRLLESNVVRIGITEAQEDVRDATEVMRSEAMRDFILGLTSKKPKEADELLARFPESPYGIYVRARVVLGATKTWWETGTGPPPDVQKEEMRKVVRTGLELVEAHREFPLADDILLGCAKTLALLRDREGAVMQLRRILAEYPMSNSVESALALQERWTRTRQRDAASTNPE